MADGMNDWVRLAERCEKATGPDREIDALIWLAFGDAKMRFSKASGGWAFFIAPFEDRQVAQLSNVKGCEAEAIKALGQYDFLPRPTASLDAITALIERELPGWRVRWHTDGDGVHEAFLEDKGDFDAIDARHTETFAASPALALCAAFCRAMNEKEANA